LKTLEGDEIRCRYPNFVTLRKNEFSRPRQLKSQNCFGQCLGPCCTDFNTGKNQGVTLGKFGEKKCFRPKEIRRFDGTDLMRRSLEGRRAACTLIYCSITRGFFLVTSRTANTNNMDISL
jgi:hypothetical protein